MRIGVAKEIKQDEYRVALTPAGALELTRQGHEVVIETGAGLGSAMPDGDYERVGAGISSVDDVWENSDLVLKVKEPIEPEYRRLRENLILFTYLHIAADEPLTRALLDSGITAVAYETVEVGRSLPLLAVPLRALRGAGASHKIFDLSILGRVTLLAGDARATLEHLDAIAMDIRRGLYPETDEAVVCALAAAIMQEDSAARDRWIGIALADEAAARRVAGRARRAFAQAERTASEGDLDLAISLLGESAESFGQSFLPFGETLARRRRIELLLRRNGAGDRDAAQAELAAILPYWRKAKATWYLGQLERWAAEHGLAFSREGVGADSIVASP